MLSWACETDIIVSSAIKADNFLISWLDQILKTGAKLEIYKISTKKSREEINMANVNIKD